MIRELRWQREEAGTARRADWVVTVDSTHRSEPLAVAVCAKGHPRQIQGAINQLLLFRHHSNNPLTYLVVAAPTIGDEGAAMCRKEKIGYYDLAGNCHLMFGTFFIERSGQRGASKHPQSGSDLFAARSERVLRVLFRAPQQAWKVVPLAATAEVSLGTVSAVRKSLLERDWAKDTPEGIRLVRPDRLLTDWAVAWGRRPLRPRTFHTRQSLPEIELRMAEYARERLVPFALTGLAGAWRAAPMSQYIRTQVYWEGAAEGLAQGVDLQPVETGANVHILVPRDQGVFADLTVIEKVQVVSPLQLYLDLQHEAGRGAEAAKHLWETVLFPADGAAL